MTRAALLAGATGLTGGKLLTQLLCDARYGSVNILVRQAGKFSDAVSANPKKLVAHVVDFDHLGTMSNALKKIDDAYCCLGTTIKKAGSKEAFCKVDFDYVLNVARAAKAAGAKRFLVISALGADAKSSVFYNRIKGEMEEALSEFSFGELHIFQPSFLAGHRAESRPAERIGIAAFKLLSPLLIGPVKKYRTIEATQVARAMIAAAFADDVGRHVYASDVIAGM